MTAPADGTHVRGFYRRERPHRCSNLSTTHITCFAVSLAGIANPHMETWKGLVAAPQPPLLITARPMLTINRNGIPICPKTQAMSKPRGLSVTDPATWFSGIEE